MTHLNLTLLVGEKAQNYAIKEKRNVVEFEIPKKNFYFPLGESQKIHIISNFVDDFDRLSKYCWDSLA